MFIRNNSRSVKMESEMINQLAEITKLLQEAGYKRLSAKEWDDDEIKIIIKMKQLKEGEKNGN